MTRGTYHPAIALYVWLTLPAVPIALATRDGNRSVYALLAKGFGHTPSIVRVQNADLAALATRSLPGAVGFAKVATLQNDQVVVAYGTGRIAFLNARLAIGQWAADAGPEVLAVLGAVRGPAEESTFRRTFALVGADVLDRVLGAWLWTRTRLAGGRLVIAVDGKTVRGAKNTNGKAPHLVAGLAHGSARSAGRSPWPRRAARFPRYASC